MLTPHPIPYQGSKRWIAPVIVSCLPKDTSRLLEPFAGSAAITLAAAQRAKVKEFLLGDINAPLIRLWEAIIYRPEELANQYEALWAKQKGQERVFYDSIRDRFNRKHQPADFLYLLARCVKAAIRYNHKGEFNNSPDNRRRGAHPETMRHRIRGASRLLRGKTQLDACDYTETLRKAHAKDVIYMDPPYQGVCRKRDSRYLGPVCRKKFEEALSELNARGISFIISYDGRCGTQEYGEPLPEKLELVHLEIPAGRSSQATLLGRDRTTVESLYLSKALVDRTRGVPNTLRRFCAQQLTMF